MQELLHRRSRHAKIFDLGGRQRRAVISAGVIHYQDDEGTWRDVDTTIVDDASVPGFDKACRTVELQVFLSRVSPQPVRVMDRRGRVVTYRPQGVNAVPAVVSGNSARFNGAWQGADLEYIVTPEGLKTLIHRDPLTAPTQFAFKVEGNLTLEPHGGGYRLMDGAEVTMEVPAPWAQNAAGEFVSAGLTLSGDVLTLTCDPSATVVDPTTTIQPSATDAVLISNDPTNNYGSVAFLRVGYQLSTNQARRSILSFNLSGISGTVNTANLELNCYAETNGTTRSAQVFRVTASWGEMTITWDNQPAYTATGASAATPLVLSGAWWNADVSDIARAWLEDGQPNYGMVVIDTAEGSGNGQNSYYSREEATNTTLRPKLTIDYTEGGGGGGSARRRFATII